MIALLSLLACTPPSDSPDIVLILVDSLRADAVGYDQASRDVTPWIDALAAESAYFSRAHATSNWVLPSVTSMLTGRYPWEHRVVTDVITPGLYGALAPWHGTMTRNLDLRGYETAAFLNQPFLSEVFGLNSGFDHFSCCGERSDEQTADEALAWLGEAEGPVFLMVHFNGPHINYTPSPPCAGRFSGDNETFEGDVLSDEQLQQWWAGEQEPPQETKDWVRSLYEEEVCEADRAVGNLLAGLRDRERWSQTRLALTAPHGTEFWDHSAFGHGHSQRSSQTNVPLIVYGPDLVPGENRTVLDLSHLREFLEYGSGKIGELARSGDYYAGGLAWSGSPKRVMDQVSVISETIRLTVLVESESAELWQVDENGYEDKLLAGARGRETVESLPGFEDLKLQRPKPFTAALPSFWSRVKDIDAATLKGQYSSD